ncbi:MAG: peroxiredoxin [Phycisphaerae bacterium]|nr:peroxiredoxin [Phycisphaerae bacterium]HQL55023.1 peroxiredoxin [Phycisphaerae bacterium]
MKVQVGQPAPDFTAQAVVNGQFEPISLSSYRGKNVVLFFWPLDFTFVCPTEIVAFQEALPKFTERNTVVLGVSVDSQYTHLAWQNTPRAAGGLGRVDFPMISDLTHEISENYGVLLENAGVALRGLFLIDKAGNVRHMLINDLPLGRSVDEALRMVDALTHFEKHGEVCPANWKPGAKSMKPDPQGAKAYFNEWGK